VWSNVRRGPSNCRVAVWSITALLALMSLLGPAPGTRNWPSSDVLASVTAADLPDNEVSVNQLSTRYDIKINNVYGGPDSRPPLYYTNNVTISGNVSAIGYLGQLDQHHVRVDWGDGTPVLDTAWLDLTPGAEARSFTGLWESLPHTYTQSGNYSVAATLYHMRPPGEDESEDAIQIISILVIVPPAIAGVVFDDFNANGVWDLLEGGLSNVAIDISGTDNRSTETNELGFYVFNDLPAGPYTVTETNPVGYVSTTPDMVEVVAEANAVAVADFGDSNTIAFINGMVFNDEDADGERDQAELGLSGATVSLG
jgi:hypothetical protein